MLGNIKIRFDICYLSYSHSNTLLRDFYSDKPHPRDIIFIIRIRIQEMSETFLERVWGANIVNPVYQVTLLKAEDPLINLCE